MIILPVQYSGLCQPQFILWHKVVISRVFFRALHLQSVSLCGLWLVSEPDVENDCIPQEFGTCDPEDMVRDSQLVENQFVYVSFICVYSRSIFSITISLCPSSFSAVTVSVSQPLPLTDHPDITALVDWTWNTNLLTYSLSLLPLVLWR